MPTVLDYAGIAHPEEYRGQKVERMRGRSLAGVLAGSTNAAYDDDDFVGGEMQDGKWMRQGRYKAVSVAPPYGSGEWKLYDVVSDPGETRDLSVEHPEKLSELRVAWDRYAGDVGVISVN
jgi:arylsulfatase